MMGCAVLIKKIHDRVELLLKPQTGLFSDSNTFQTFSNFSSLVLQKIIKNVLIILKKNFLT